MIKREPIGKSSVGKKLAVVGTIAAVCCVSAVLN